MNTINKILIIQSFNFENQNTLISSSKVFPSHSKSGFLSENLYPLIAQEHNTLPTRLDKTKQVLGWHSRDDSIRVFSWNNARIYILSLCVVVLSMLLSHRYGRRWNEELTFLQLSKQ